MEDTPFRAVSQAGLVGTTDFKVVKDCLQKRFAPDGNELEWQFRLQGRSQKPVAEFSGDCWLVVHIQAGLISNN